MKYRVPLTPSVKRVRLTNSETYLLSACLEKYRANYSGGIFWNEPVWKPLDATIISSVKACLNLVGHG